MTVVPFLLALDVASSLTASGVDATTRLGEDNRVELLLMLLPRSRTMAVLDICDMSTALIDGPSVAVRTVPGPLDPGVETCRDPPCLTVAVWSWVLAIRGTEW